MAWYIIALVFPEMAEVCRTKIYLISFSNYTVSLEKSCCGETIHSVKMI